MPQSSVVLNKYSSTYEKIITCKCAYCLYELTQRQVGFHNVHNQSNCRFSTGCGKKAFFYSGPQVSGLHMRINDAFWASLHVCAFGGALNQTPRRCCLAKNRRRSVTDLGWISTSSVKQLI